MTIPSSSPLATSACWWGSRPSIASRSVSSAGRPGELADDVALGRGDGQLGADGRGALRHARHDLDAREGQADRAVAAQLVAEEEGGVAVERARAGDAAEHRHARSAARELAEHEVGRERVGVGEQDDARSRRRARAARRPRSRRRPG